MTLDNLKYALILNNKLLLDRLKTFMHTHENLPTLNGLSANEAGSLLFNGNLVNEQYEVTDAEIKAMVDQVIAELDKETGTGGTETPTPTPAVEFEWWSPQMTSNNTPSPYAVTASSEPFSDRHAAWMAFDGNPGENGNMWHSDNEVGWIQFDFGASVLLHGIKIVPNADASQLNAISKVFVFSGSNDGTSFTTLFTATADDNSYTPTPNVYRECMFEENTTPYRYYKIDTDVNYDGTYYSNFGDIQFYKQKDA